MFKIYNYDKNGAVESSKINKKNYTWVDAVNPTDEELEQIAKSLDLPLFELRQIREKGVRPHLTFFDDFLTLTFRVPKHLPKNGEFETDRVNIFFSKRNMLTIHSGVKEVEKVKTRLLAGKDKKLLGGLDFVFYVLLDELVERFYPMLLQLDNRIDKLELEILEDPTPETLQRVFALKQAALQLHKMLWAEREILLGLQKNVVGIQLKNQLYFRDVYDHIIQLIDTVDVGRDALSSSVDLYLSVSSNKMNEVMKVLTVIATITLPLTLITGIYGMNFRYMPELQHPYGYYGTLLFMALLGGFMWTYFKKRDWV